MDRLRETIRETDPAAAATLAEAAREAGTRGIAERMREVGNEVARNRLGNASQAQSEIEQGLQPVLSALTDSQGRTPRDMSQQQAQQLATALEQLKIQLTNITSGQQTLLDETSQWRDSGTSLLRPAEMAPAQQQLANDTKAAREQLPLPKAFEFGMKSVEAIMGAATEQLKLHTPDERVERLQGEARGHSTFRLRSLRREL